MKAETFQRYLLGTASLFLAAGVWLPCVHFFFKKSPETFRCKESIAPKARELAARHLQLWTDPALRRRELEKMRASNAEWDFMGRSFLVWSLANMGLREPAAKQTYLTNVPDGHRPHHRRDARARTGAWHVLFPDALREGAPLRNPAGSKFVLGRRNRPDAGRTSRQRTRTRAGVVSQAARRGLARRRTLPCRR